MSETYDPILEITELRRLRVGAPLRTPAMGTTMVLERATGAPLVVEHGQAVPDPRIGNYRRMYLVDTGTHGLSFSTNAPSADPAFPFIVRVDFACRVVNPVVIAVDHVRNMTAALSPSLTTVARSIAVGFDVMESAAAEASITARLNAARPHHAVLLSDFVATVEPADVAEIVTARRELRVQEIRRDAMLPVARGGREELMAQYMALAGGDPTELLDRELKEQQMATQASLAALQLLMSSEKLEEFDTSRVTEQTMSKFFPGGDNLISKKSGIRDRLERKHRGELAAGGPVVEEARPSSSDGKASGADKPAESRRASRVRGSAKAPEDG